MTSSWTARASFPDALGCQLPVLEVARPDEHCKAVRREILCDLKTDSLVGPGDQSDRVVLHDELLGGLIGGEAVHFTLTETG